MKLDGARVVITGASRGIGEQLARACAAKGAQVVVVARSTEALQKLAADIGGEAFTADLSDPSQIEPLVDDIHHGGPIDVLVNNAGVDLTGNFVDLAWTDIGQLLAVNLLAPMLLCWAVIPGMEARRRGHIMNVSSLAGTNAVPGVVPYSSSKAGLSQFTAGLRAELKGTPITTTLVEIGTVEASMADNLRAHPPTQRALQRLGRLGVVVDLEMDTVIAALVTAIERERRHVRMPKRDAVFPMLVETPRRITELLLTGVKAR
jgi:short-subunit dehydrogenase